MIVYCDGHNTFFYTRATSELMKCLTIMMTAKIKTAVVMCMIYISLTDSENAIFSLIIGIPKNLTQEVVHSILTKKKKAPPDTTNIKIRISVKYL
jgi:hypothetical protein